MLSLRILYHFGVSAFVYQADIQHAMSLPSPFSSLIRLFPHHLCSGLFFIFNPILLFIAAFSLRILYISYLVGLTAWEPILNVISQHWNPSILNPGNSFHLRISLSLIKKPFGLVLLILSASNPALKFFRPPRDTLD